jgi:hypothetical protein
MPATRSSPSTPEVANEYVVWGTGFGIVSFALFPFLLPGIAVLAVFALPLLVIPLVGLVAAAVVALPLLGARALWRRARRRRIGGPHARKSVEHRQVEVA